MESLWIATKYLGGKISGRVRNLHNKDLTITQLGYASDTTAILHSAS